MTIDTPRHAPCIACQQRGYRTSELTMAPVRCRLCRGTGTVEIVDDQDAANRAAEIERLVADARKGGAL